MRNANDRVNNQIGLMREKNDLHRQLRSVRAQVAPDTPEVTGPGNAARMNQQTRRRMNVHRKGEDQQHQERPPKWIDGKNRPTGSQEQNDRWRKQTATQIVENLPTRNRSYVIRTFISVRVSYFSAQPSGNLPVAARPAMLALGVGVIVSGVIVEKLDITNQRRAREG